MIFERLVITKNIYVHLNKTIMKILKTLCAALMCMAFASCSQNLPSPEQVAQKIDSNETLTEADYTTMIDYCGDYSKKAQEYFDLINAQPSDSTAEYTRASEELANLYSANPYIDIFRSAIYAANDSAIGAKNVAKVKEFEKYQAFPLPEGEGASLNQPGVVGDIVETPNNDSSAVIAAGIGEEVTGHSK